MEANINYYTIVSATNMPFNAFENSPFYALPQELVLSIFDSLNTQDLIAVKTTCHEWRQTITDQTALIIRKKTADLNQSVEWVISGIADKDTQTKTTQYWQHISTTHLPNSKDSPVQAKQSLSTTTYLFACHLRLIQADKFSTTNPLYHSEITNNLQPEACLLINQTKMLRILNANLPYPTKLIKIGTFFNQLLLDNYTHIASQFSKGVARKHNEYVFMHAMGEHFLQKDQVHKALEIAIKLPGEYQSHLITQIVNKLSKDPTWLNHLFTLIQQSSITDALKVKLLSEIGKTSLDHQDIESAQHIYEVLKTFHLTPDAKRHFSTFCTQLSSELIKQKNLDQVKELMSFILSNKSRDKVAYQLAKDAIKNEDWGLVIEMLNMIKNIKTRTKIGALYFKARTTLGLQNILHPEKK